MVKFVKFIWSVVLALSLFCVGFLAADKLCLRENVIRLHVVANSDTEEDQSTKLAVRDAVTAYLNNEMKSIKDSDEAKAFIEKHLDQIQDAASATLCGLGVTDPVSVTFDKETFDTRYYDTFKLPSGVYQSLRINIGNAQGQNWWCVVFPSLCIPETAQTFRTTAVSAGFDDGLANTLSGEDGYEVRFFFLDCFGKLENFFYSK